MLPRQRDNLIVTEKRVPYCLQSSCDCDIFASRRRALAAWTLLVVGMLLTAMPSASANDSYRPQFHLTPPSGWMNDPCGLYYANGLYHRNYLWSPESAPVDWGDNWAHLVSTDLVHWTSYPLTVANDPVLGKCWTGSGFVDTDNTGGFQTGVNKAQVVAFTTLTQAAGQNIGLAYSNDNGVTWTRYANNPIIARPNDGNDGFRDPDVFWYAPENKWVMAVSRGCTAPGSLYQSSNLKDWSFMSQAPAGECPDMFQLPVDNQPGVKRWVYTSGSNNSNGVGANYFLCNFDGTSFTSTSQAYTMGGSFYVGQSFKQIPSTDGRRIYIGWKSLPASQYGTLGDWTGGVQTIPVSLSLRDIPKVGVRMCYSPVEELESLRGEHFSLEPQTIDHGNTVLSSQGILGELLEITATFQLDTATEFGFQLRKGSQGACTVGYNTLSQMLSFTPSTGSSSFSQSLTPIDGQVKLHIFLDRSVVDIFGNDGITWNSEFFKADPSSLGLELYTTGGKVQLLSLDVWQLTAVPEPSASSLLGMGILCGVFAYCSKRRWQRRHRAATDTR